MIQYKQDALPELAFGFGKTYINGGDIVTQTITADKLIKTLALVASQFIQAGNVKIGKDSSGNGYLEIGAPSDTYYLKFNQGTGVFDIQANLKVAKDANTIKFVDSQITLADYGYSSPDLNSTERSITFWTRWLPDIFNEISFYFEKIDGNFYKSRIRIETHSAFDFLNAAELYSKVYTDGSGYSGIKLDSCGYYSGSNTIMRDSAIIDSVFLYNPDTLKKTSYFDFSRPIYFQPSLATELLANYPNGTLGVGANGNLRFKKSGTWFDVGYQPTNTTSTSNTTTEPTFPENPVDGDYHEHTYTGTAEPPKRKILYIYKFGKWYYLGSIPLE